MKKNLKISTLPLFATLTVFILTLLLVSCSPIGKNNTETTTQDGVSVNETQINSESETDSKTNETGKEDNSKMPDTSAPTNESESSDSIPPCEETLPPNMPRIDITTENNQEILSKDYYIPSKITLSDCDDFFQFSNIDAGVRLRGNSTAAAPKKPYRIKFNTKQSFLGLNNGKKFKSWCLMADYYDGSMQRTLATFKLADILLENKYYSADCTPVEVYVNNEYQGVYLLCEQTQINKNRVNIPENPENDHSIQTGYLLIGQGGRTDEPETVVVYPEITVTDRNGKKMYYGAMNFALSGNGYTDEQKEYVSNYVSGVFKVMASALYENKYYSLTRDGQLIPKTDFQGKTAKEKQIETIDAVFNIESAVGMCILDELVKNLDAMTFNMYVDLSPNGDGRLTLAAPWDFDFAMANTHYESTHSSSGFYATNLSESEGIRVNIFYVMLGKINWFEEMMEERWKTHYEEIKAIPSLLDQYSLMYKDAYERDYAKWGKPKDRMLIHHHDQNDLSRFETHADAGKFLSGWLEKRISWLNRRWGNTTESAEQSDKMLFDFTQNKNLSYLSGFKNCQASITNNGLFIQTTEAHDPYFYLDLENFDEVFYAEDYPYIEIEYTIPLTNKMDDYVCELFLCTGNRLHAEGGYSVPFALGQKDGKSHIIKIDLSEYQFWAGQINKIRIDYFSACENGDTFYIKSIKIKTN